MNRERKEQLRKVSSQLLLFEARLSRKQREISLMLSQREVVIAKQLRTIKELQTKLKEAGLAEETCTNLDSLNDSDSAVIMEDEDGIPSGAWHGVARSVSDAKYALLRRSSGMFLRRPEVLETVYSVEEDPDADASSASSQPTQEISNASKLKQIGGSFERLDPPPLTAYNRVMSNHRSVTKPKDVKYKRINKAKSKSLEELRGRLKSWVDKSHKFTSSVDQ